ncbi:MAG: hypothetical protein IPM39_19960 [Chloroflexi bacterium]|nr:hypothetical protein [Chloroflexota bacterium]
MVPPVDEAVPAIASVFVVTAQRLLGDALEQLLNQEGRLQVHRLTPGAPQTMMQVINQQRPLVVIIDEELLTDELFIRARHVGENGRFQFIILSSVHNRIFICQFNHVVLAKVADLVSPIMAFLKQSPGCLQGDSL